MRSEARHRRHLPRREADGFGHVALRVGALIARPGAVIFLGMNYAARATESGSPSAEVPIVFHKTPNTVVGPHDAVLIPRGSEKTDLEVELGVVVSLGC